jgi:hypothetical protein
MKPKWLHPLEKYEFFLAARTQHKATSMSDAYVCKGEPLVHKWPPLVPQISYMTSRHSVTRFVVPWSEFYTINIENFLYFNEFFPQFSTYCAYKRICKRRRENVDLRKCCIGNKTSVFLTIQHCMTLIKRLSIYYLRYILY